MKRNQNNTISGKGSSIAGFTILELLVSVSIFTIVIFISLTSVVVIFANNRKSDSLRSSVDNANFAFEVMTREIRFGLDFTCDGARSCQNGSSLSFTGSDGRDITYSTEQGRLVRSINGEENFPLTSSRFTVDTMNFTLTGGSNSDNMQPKTTLYMSGIVSPGTRETSVFDLQTTVTSRQIDI